MIDLVLTFSITAAASLALTAAAKALARRWGVVDWPDGRRKLHLGPVPLWGGVAVYLAIVLGLSVARLGSFGIGEPLDELAATILAAAGVVCFVGCLDDCCRLTPRWKLLLQVGAVLPVVLVGYSVDSITAFGCTIELGWLGVAITALWLVGCINAMNLLDGMDGLASIVGISTAVMMGAIAHYMGNNHVALVAVVLAGALAGFLVHNLPPARIFLGDSGSMVIGLVVGILGVHSTLKTSATLSITAPLVVMTFPMFDTVLAIVRRKLTGRRFDAADRQHIHHRLLDRGMNPWLVLGIIGALCLATGVAATVATIVRSDALAWATAVTLIVLAVRLRLFGHHELALVSGTLARGFKAAASRLGGSPAGDAAPAAAELGRLAPGEAWGVLVDRLKPWRVRRLQLVFSLGQDSRWGHVWVDSMGDFSGEARWSVAVRVSRDERSCELRAAGFDATGTDSLPPAELTAVLKAFAAYFADHPDEAAELVDLAAAAEESLGSDFPGRSQPRRRAA